MQSNSLRRRGICIVIPTFDNAGTIADVVARAMAQCPDVIVVCDGCTDNTVPILRAMPCQPVIIELDANRGKGYALREGFRYARKAGFAYAITLDGDGQHFPEDIPTLVEAGRKHPGALIVGERKNLDSVSRSKGSRFANAFSNFWFALQTGCFLKDTQTGFRLYPLKKLYGLSLLTSRYEAELELMVFAAWHGVKLVSEPVNVFYPPREERVSHFRPGKDFARIFIMNTVLCILAVVYALPLFICRTLLKVLKSLFTLLAFIIVTLFIATPVAMVYMGIGKTTEKKKYNLHRMINTVAKFFAGKLPGVRYTQSENPNGLTDKPSVIICNHQSHLDLLPMLAFSEKLVILTTDWVWNDPFYGYIIRKAEYLPASKGIDNILPQLKSLADRGYSIAVYPEGTRSTDCSIGRFHQGAFHIAGELGLDILPLVLYGSGHALPKHGRILHRWPMHLEICRKITRSELEAMGPNTREQASAMREWYKEQYSLLADKMEQDV